jgi:hypothetical protein
VRSTITDLGAAAPRSVSSIILARRIPAFNNSSPITGKAAFVVVVEGRTDRVGVDAHACVSFAHVRVEPAAGAWSL